MTGGGFLICGSIRHGIWLQLKRELADVIITTLEYNQGTYTATHNKRNINDNKRWNIPRYPAANCSWAPLCTDHRTNEPLQSTLPTMCYRIGQVKTFNRIHGVENIQNMYRPIAALGSLCSAL